MFLLRKTLAAQCSATRDSVVATPPCSAIRFRFEIDPPTPLVAGGGKIGATGFFFPGGWGRCSATPSRHLENCRDTVCLSGPNRARQPRCAMRFESHTPQIASDVNFFFASDARTHSLDLKS